jgi:dTMP kinase
MRHKGLFITFEGIDGCGKSTHVELARRLLRRRGHSVKVLREPGSTPVAEKIRDILLDRRSCMTPVTELLLYEAARADLVERQIAPLLRQGRIVLCDRFYDSTTAYQGYGRKLDIGMVTAMHSVAVGKVRPDLTFLFDVDLRTAFERLGREPDRLESESRAFFRKVRAGFLAIARKEPRRVKVIDAAQSIDDVFEEVRYWLLKRL